MFSFNIARLSLTRGIAPLLAACAWAVVVTAQELAAPLPPPSANQVLLPPQGAAIAPSRAQLPDVSAPPVPMDAAAKDNSLVHRIQAPTERMELTVNSSRVLSLDQNIPRAQVNNREIIELTALSPNEIQVLAKKAGVTQINLWNDKGQIYTIDCVVYGDARELAELLKSEFPAANLKVRPMASSVLLTGFVDRSDQISQIIQIAQDYYPKVVPNITVGGVQQILLHVKVAEVSRTKARSLGFDFANINGNSFIASSVSGLLSAATVTGAGFVPAGAGDTVRFGLVDGNNAFFGFLDALRKENILKILSDPTLTTVSGRPAFFNSGGEFPILVPQSLGTVSIEYKKFGTQVDFLPIVLGNGNIRLEVRPRISEIDNTRSITINGTTVPGLRVREADTGVEMKSGQTLAIAGLVQTRVQAEKREIPWLGETPYIGAAFRRVHEEVEEVELLILVTPQVVEPLDPCEMPQCFPGMHTDSPKDCDLYWKGHLEVPSKGPCGPCGCGIQGGMGPSYGPEVAPPGSGGPGSMYEAVPPGSPSLATPPTDASTRNLRGRRGAAPLSTVDTGITQNSPGNSDNRYNPALPPEARSASAANRSGPTPGFIGPTGYDVLK